MDSTRPDAAAEVQNELLINMFDLIDQLSNRLQAVEALLHTTSNNIGERPAKEQQQPTNTPKTQQQCRADEETPSL